MNTIQIGKRKVVIYDSIDEIAMDRFHLFNKYLIIEAGVGESVDDVLKHIGRIKKYVEVADKESIYSELDNLAINFNTMFTNANLRGKAFCCLVESIDGEPVERKDEEFNEIVIERIYKKISKSSYGLIGTIISNAKKKMEEELSIYFQGKFSSSSNEKEFYTSLKHRAMLLAKEIMTGQSQAVGLANIDRVLLRLSRPTIFAGERGFEVRYNKAYETAKLMLTKHYNTNAGKFKVLQYYQAIDLIEKNGRQ